MRWIKHNELSDDDMNLLTGSDIIAQLMRCRLVIKFHDDEVAATPKEMGLRECEGMYHIRKLDHGNLVYEILFENEQDRQMVERHLANYKLTLN